MGHVGGSEHLEQERRGRFGDVDALGAVGGRAEQVERDRVVDLDQVEQPERAAIATRPSSYAELSCCSPRRAR